MKTSQIRRFSKEQNARNFATRTKMQRIFLGDDGKFWVVSMAMGEKLTAQGYEEI